jgi:hypothetical protein
VLDQDVNKACAACGSLKGYRDTPCDVGDLLCLVDGTNQQEDTDRQEIDFRERHLDVAGDDQFFVKDTVENVGLPGRSSMPSCQMRQHKPAILRNSLVRAPVGVLARCRLI